MIIPEYLNKGDTILIIATARKISREEIDPVITALESWGLRVVQGPNLLGCCNQYSGSDAERAADLQWALDHPTAKAIMNARGGYGTMRIIDDVDFSGFRRKPKWLVGYSDVTVLHSHLNTLGFCSIHGTMPVNLLKDEASALSVRDLLFGKDISYEIPQHPLNRNGNASGPMAGGNLSILYALSGSISEMDYKGKILFIEDLDEYLYHIDRMMLQLKRSGKLKDLAGLVVGGMTEMRDNLIPFGKQAEEIIAETVASYNYPVCFDFPAGHTLRNLAFYNGRRVSLSVTDSGSQIKYLPDEN